MLSLGASVRRRAGVLGVNVFKDVAAGIRSTFGGRSRSHGFRYSDSPNGSLVEKQFPLVFDLVE